MPLLLWLDIPAPKALAISVVSMMFQTGLNAWQLRAHIPWRETAWAASVRLVTMVLGTLMLKRIIANQSDLINLVVGVVVCATALIQWLWRVHPRDRLHPALGWTAFAISGVLGGLCGTGGPPVVLWVMSLNWDSSKTRVFLYCTFMVAVPFQLAVLYLTFGSPVAHSILQGLAVGPLVALSALLGLTLGHRLPKPHLRRLAYIILVLIGTRSIAQYFAG
jgi:uncharacterized membrane protein YfcA